MCSNCFSVYFKPFVQSPESIEKLSLLILNSALKVSLAEFHQASHTVVTDRMLQVRLLDVQPIISPIFILSIYIQWLAGIYMLIKHSRNLETLYRMVNI